MFIDKEHVTFMPMIFVNNKNTIILHFKKNSFVINIDALNSALFHGQFVVQHY